MTEVVSKRQRELKQAALKKTRDAIRQKNKLESLATNRLKKIQILQDKNTKLMDTQHNNQTYVTKDFKKVRKGRSDNKAGGAHVWPIWMLQLVLEMLVNGTPPSAIPLNIKSQAALTTPGVIIEDLPGLGYVRNCRTILRVIGETLTAYRLGKQAEWQQLFTDGTSRRQIALQNLIISILEDDILRPLVLSSAMILEGETSEQQCDAVVKMIKRGGKHLQHWEATMKNIYPSYNHDIPPSSAMNIGKLGSGGAVTSDTCNSARKSRRLLVDCIEEAARDTNPDNLNNHVIAVDCYNHLQNVWLGGMIKVLSTYLKEKLSDGLEYIDTRLRVSPNIEMVLRAADKEFSLCANYPKGHGELFYKWMDQYHPGTLLLHVERASGSRQDLCVEGAGAVYWNRKYWIEFLDTQLRTPGSNILQENLFIILSSCEMTALARVCSIVHLSICLPIRWLAGNLHKLSNYNWSVRSMGRVVDLLETALESIENNGNLILDEAFMMGIFDELLHMLPPFAEYLEHIYKHKKTKLVANSRNKVVPLSKLRDELFSPISTTNQSTVDKRPVFLG